MTAYAHEVYRYEWEPLVLREEQLTDVARDGVPGSMPESLWSKSKHELREELACSIRGPSFGAIFDVLCFLHSWR